MDTNSDQTYALPLHILAYLNALNHTRVQDRKFEEKLLAWEMALHGNPRPGWERCTPRKARRWNLLWHNWKTHQKHILNKALERKLIDYPQYERIEKLSHFLKPKNIKEQEITLTTALYSCVEMPINSHEQGAQLMPIALQSVKIGEAPSRFQFSIESGDTAQKAAGQLALQALETALSDYLEDSPFSGIHVVAQYDPQFPLNDNSIRLALVLAILKKICAIESVGVAVLGGIQTEKLAVKAVAGIDNAYSRIDACFDAGIKRLIVPVDQVIRFHPDSGIVLEKVTEYQYKYSLSTQPSDVMHIYHVEDMTMAFEVLFGKDRQFALNKLLDPDAEPVKAPEPLLDLGKVSRTLRFVCLSHAESEHPDYQFWLSQYQGVRAQFPKAFRILHTEKGILTWNSNDPTLAQDCAHMLQKQGQNINSRVKFSPRISVALCDATQVSKWNSALKQNQGKRKAIEDLQKEILSQFPEVPPASHETSLALHPLLEQKLKELDETELPEQSLMWNSMLYLEQSEIESQTKSVQSQWKKHLLQFLQEIPVCIELAETGLIMRLKRGYLFVVPHFDFRILRLLEQLFQELPELQKNSSQPEKWQVKASLQVALLPMDPDYRNMPQITHGALDRLEGLAYIGTAGHILMNRSTAELLASHPHFPQIALHDCGAYDLSSQLHEEVFLFAHEHLGNAEPPLHLPIAMRVAEIEESETPKHSELEILGRAHYQILASRHPKTESDINVDIMSQQIKDLILRALEHPGQFFFTRPVRYLHNSLGMIFRLILPGHFVMGSPPNEAGRADDEVQHMVSLDYAFYMMTTPVTQFQWEQIMGENPSFFKDPEAPVENVSWDEIQIFIHKLESQSTGRYYLPTEAEWEYCCRAGAEGPFGMQNEMDARLHDYAWFADNSDMGYDKRQTHPVATRMPNNWGLFDFHGNVWEWVQDWYGPYPEHLLNNPRGPYVGDARVIRGGRWNSEAEGCRAALRSALEPHEKKSANLGFRLVYLPGARPK